MPSNITPSHFFEPTDNPHLFRLVDADGDWTFYAYAKDLDKDGQPKGKIEFLPAVNHILTHGYAKGSRFYDYLLRSNAEEAKKTLESAGDRGTRVHTAIRDMLYGKTIKIDSKYPSEVLRGRQEPLTQDEWNCLQGFANFCIDHRPERFKVESAVMSLGETKYAGTVDFVGTITTDLVAPGRTTVVLDWKSSSAIYPEYYAQIAAYAKTFTLPVLSTGIVRVGTRHKRKYELKLFTPEETAANYKRFLAAVEIYHESFPADYSPEIEQLPSFLRVKVPEVNPVEAKPKKTRKTKNPKKQTHEPTR